MAGGFSVQGIEIEGFKGFTSSKEIDFKGRHVFLLGQNGNGKSSIVEAVHWGLFGSAYRPNEVIKNQRYSGNCRVTVKLIRDGEFWTLRRTLNLGTGSSSEPVLTDQYGNRSNIRDVMPQLDSVDAGEGTHIIFAPQSAPLQKQPENLDPFERTVFNYLGLTHPRVLLSNIEEFLEDQTEIEHELGDELTEVRESIDNQIKEIRTLRSPLLSDPPWGNGPVPSIVVSEQKVRSFIEEISGKPPGDELAGLSLDALLESAEKSLSNRRTQGQGSLEKEREDLAGHRVRLEKLRNVRTQVKLQKSTVQDTQSKLETVMNGLTSNELREKLTAAKYEAATESIKGRIVQDTISLISRGETKEFPCPVCDSLHDSQMLEASLRAAPNHLDKVISSTVITLESQLQKSVELENLLKEQDAELRSLNHNETVAMIGIGDEDTKKLDQINDIEGIIDNYVSLVHNSTSPAHR